MFLVVFLEKVYICFELLLIFKSVIIRKNPNFQNPPS